MTDIGGYQKRGPRKGVQGGRRIRRFAGRFIRPLKKAFGSLGGSLVSTVRNLGLEKPARVMGGVRFGRWLRPTRRFWIEYEALLLARAKGWAPAVALFQEMDSREQHGKPLKGRGATAMLGGSEPRAACRLTVPVTPRTASFSNEKARNVIVYTAYFGNGPAPPALFGMPDGLRGVCFTDQPISPDGWQIVPTKAYDGAPDYHRICPHKVLWDVDPMVARSLYVDPARLIVGNMHTLLTRWLSAKSFVVWPQPDCTDWHELAERHLVLGSAASSAVLRQATTYERIRVPLKRGACDTGAIWRHHQNSDVSSILDLWWKLHQETLGAADMSFYRLLCESKSARTMVTAMPSALKRSDDNLFFSRNNRAISANRHHGRVRKSATARLPVAFLCPQRFHDRIAAMLRGRQLSEMVQAAFPDRYDVSFVSDIENVKGSVVILTTHALSAYNAEMIRALKTRNIAAIGSWEDGRPNSEKVAQLDAHMTFSIRQMLDFNRLFPTVPAFHVTHHVNPRFPKKVGHFDRLRTAYFGDVNNVMRPDSLSDEIQIFDTWEPESSWLHQMTRYNCHWIVRRHNPRYPWKPFLKGFVAARCGVPVVVSRDDENAPYYLGDDYPFYADGTDSEALEMAWLRLASAFGGQDWELAKDIMGQVAARCSDIQVCCEFKAMLDEVLR